MQITEVARCFTQQHLEAILQIDRESFSEQYADAADYYRKALENPDNINVFLKDGEKLIGYLLAIPHNEARKELLKDDREILEDPERYYVETAEVLPGYRTGRGSFKMIMAMIEEAKKRGKNRFSMHTRVNNGFSKLVQMYFGRMITQVRRIENWPYYENNEPTEYLEGTYEKK